MNEQATRCTTRLEVGEIKARAAGQWTGLLHHLGNQALQEAVGRYESSPGAVKHGPCPVHGGVNGDAFRLFKDVPLTGGGYCNTCGAFHDGFKLLQAVNGWSFPETLERVAAQLQFTPRVPPSRATAPGTPDPEQARLDQRRLQAMRRLYLGSRPLTHREDPAVTQVRRYLAHRGINRLPEGCDLRAHPALPYKGDADEADGCFGAMLALVRNPEGQVVGMHRTYLAGEDKAPVRTAKKELPRPSTLHTRGGAIRLGHPVGTTLGVAEGIETALACWMATGLLTWSTLNRVLMEQFVPPPEVTKVVIFADKDQSGAGQLSAAKLAQRLLMLDRDVVILQPRPPIPSGAAGIDWNDVLLTQGPTGFSALEFTSPPARQAPAEHATA